MSERRKPAALPIRHALHLPNPLRDAIDRALEQVPTPRWMREAQALSERYRGERAADDQPLATGPLQALGYAALILPAAYAQLRGALAATAARIPHWNPATMLDLGSGPGTALWAATEQWPSITTISAWERESAFISLGRTLARQAATPALHNAHWKQVDVRQIDHATEQRYDLVILGHVLNELNPEAQQRVVAAAWRLTGGLLLVVEPGTPAGFAVVRAARDHLLAQPAHTIAPCAHDEPCPLQDDWCHFPQRLKRPDFQRRARGAPSEWEDSKYAYAALARFAAPEAIWGRVIREATSNKAYAETKISAQEGVHRFRALKRHRDAFRHIKNLEWGDALPDTPPEGVEQV